ncbi:ABC transporter permease [SAR202 cluster bacterium AC-647-N09_OGT_505m]|nr:ABC transporter permease [SAR202 cluster bacterium AC-647-N09_OGT_505m]
MKNRHNHTRPQPNASRANLVTEAQVNIWTYARTNPLALLSVAVLILMGVTALMADFVAPYDPLAQNAAEVLRPPGPDHYFGTDGLGRDIFSRVVYGSRVSLYVGFLAAGIAAVVGTFAGTVSAYCGGKLDLAIQRVIDIFLGFPFLVLALIMVVALGSSPTSLAVAISISLAPQVTRLSRATGLSIKRELYVEAARVIGASSYQVICRHMLPNGFPPVLAQVTGYFGAAVVAETALSFLGLGVSPPSPSWGRMLQEGARQYFEVAPWATVFPGLALSLTVVSFALLGDAVRDMLDPRRSY